MFFILFITNCYRSYDNSRFSDIYLHSKAIIIDSNLQKSSKLSCVQKDLSSESRLVSFTVFVGYVKMSMLYSVVSSAASAVRTVIIHINLDVSMYNLVALLFFGAK